MRRCKKVIGLILFVAITISAMAFSTVSAAKSGDFEYEIMEDGNVCITAYHGSNENLVFPSTIAGRTVTAVVASFKSNKNLKTVVYPDTVVSLAEKINGKYISSRYVGCRNLESVKLSENIININGFSVTGSYELKYFEVPQGVAKLPAGFLIGCENLLECRVPSSVNDLTVGNRPLGIDDSFPGSANLVLIVDQGSYAEYWAKQNNRKYRYRTEATIPGNWVQKNGNWYFTQPNGTNAINSWIQTNGTWYYCDRNGIMMYGRWILPDGKTWYYLNGNGAKQTGWLYLGSKWYYCDRDGRMLANTTTPDGYRVNADGVWIK